ncbi:DUF1294 domain-containing protein [Flavobacterium sp. CF136]|uniref:DUF1294 domain-containing protein n=1 Tax=Flavobacterium sp. (strain CF136) TaxID=1144313 RepID=UPI0002715B22|nr:DUF1294 domain-containing protein [Flavobacterium sp. CF136]EJL62933.1 putative membrane protein [Flavobacterium sp. CF136]
MKILLIYFLIVNGFTFLIAGYDKYLAGKNKRRIPEKMLFSFALFGGSAGLLLAMLIFKHKTSKSSFIVKFSAIFLIQIMVVYLKLSDKI